MMKTSIYTVPHTVRTGNHDDDVGGSCGGDATLVFSRGETLFQERNTAN